MNKDNFDEASGHHYRCQCDICQQWWAEVGPEDISELEDNSDDEIGDDIAF